MFKRLMGVLTVLVVVLAAGCSSKPSTGGSETKPAQTENKVQTTDANKPVTLAVVVKNVVNPFYKLVRIGADQAAKDIGNVKLVHVAPTKPDNLDESIQIMDDLITRYKAKSIDGVVFVPVDYKAMVPVVEKANQAGLPIVNYSNRLAAGGKYVTYIGYDDKLMAQDEATAVFEKLGSKGNVIIIEGVPGAITAQDRLAGFKAALAKYPNIKVLASQTANYSRAEALRVTENLLQQFTDVQAILAANDEMALGAIKALEAKGLAGKVLVSGTDGAQDGLTAVKNGTLTITVDYSGYEMGYAAVKAAVTHVRGGQVSGDQLLKHSLVTKDNADQFLTRLNQRLAP